MAKSPTNKATVTASDRASPERSSSYPQASAPARPQARSTDVLRIVSKAPRGHRRAGRRFDRDPRDVPVANLTPDQAKSLAADPRLEIEVVEPKPHTPEKGAGPSAGSS